MPSLSEILGNAFGGPGIVPANDALLDASRPRLKPGMAAHEDTWRDSLTGGIASLLPGSSSPYSNYQRGKDVVSGLDWTGVADAVDAADAITSGDPAALGMAALSAAPGVNIRAEKNLIEKGVKQLPEIMATATKPKITAYHGTPHSFDKFKWDTSTRGTGEGAQAYGDGLYFAGKEDVARGYRDALAPHSTTFEGKALDTPKEYWGVHDALEQGDWRQAKALDYFSKQAGPFDERLRATRNWYRDQPDMVAAIDALESKLGTKSQGHMYEVNINADPEHFLDWDRPLMEQPYVRQALGLPESIPPWQSITNEEFNAAADQLGFHIPPHIDDLSKVTGADLIDAKPRQGYGRAEDRLKAAGIPGIKFLDAGSRVSPLELQNAQSDARLWDMQIKERGYGPGWTQEGHEYVKRKAAELEAKAANQSRNYVVFDDALIEIVKKYGIVGALSAGLISEEMAQQMQAQGMNERPET